MNELIGAIYKPSIDPPGFFIEIVPPPNVKEANRIIRCHILDDGKGLIGMWNENMPNSFFWFLRYVLRIGEIATFEDVNELLLYQEERYMS